MGLGEGAWMSRTPPAPMLSMGAWEAGSRRLVRAETQIHQPYVYNIDDLF